MTATDLEWGVELLPPTDEADPRVAGEALFDLLPPGEMRARVLPLLSSPGVTLGPALGRRKEVVRAISQVPGVGEVRLSQIGGTIGPGGPAWLSLLFAARFRPGKPRPLDLGLGLVQLWLEGALPPLARGRIEGAWCPGFSDLAIGGRKLVGVGFKLRRDVLLARAVVAVRPLSPPELAVLDACHRTFGKQVQGAVLTSMAEVMGIADLSRAGALGRLGEGRAPTAKIKS